MTRNAQLALGLGHRTALGRVDFLVAPSNEVAVAWIDRWPDWTGAGLALHGPPGSGKTHLCEVWRRLSGAPAIDASALAEAGAPELLGPARACVLDGVGAWLEGDEELQRRLLHLYNLMAQRGGHLLLSGAKPPAHWPCTLADLRSRLATMAAVGLKAPDDSLLAAVLVKLFSDRQLKVEPAIIRFLVARMERSLEAAGRMVAAIDRVSLAERREITVPLVRSVLDQEQPEHAEDGG